MGSFNQKPLSPLKISTLRLMNALQTVILLALSFGILGWFSLIVFGPNSVWIVFWSLVIFILLGNHYSPQIVLMAHRAQPLDPEEAPEVYEITKQLAHKAGITCPIHLFTTPEYTLNAFSTGTKQSPVIALSFGLLQNLNLRELTGVLAHELAHITNGDLKILVLTQFVGRTIEMISLFFQFMIWLNLPFIISGQLVIPTEFVLIVLWVPFLTSLILLKISRVREYNADLVAASLLEDPDALAQALEKIGTINKSTFGKLLGQFFEPPEWLSTHPSTANRIARLQALKSQ